MKRGLCRTWPPSSPPRRCRASAAAAYRAFQQPSLTRKKLRRLELTAGAAKGRGGRSWPGWGPRQSLTSSSVTLGYYGEHWRAADYNVVAELGNQEAARGPVLSHHDVARPWAPALELWFRRRLHGCWAAGGGLSRARRLCPSDGAARHSGGGANLRRTGLARRVGHSAQGSRGRLYARSVQHASPAR